MSDPATGKRVRHFRQILLWPLQLVPIREGAQIQKHWEYLEHGADWLLELAECSGFEGETKRTLAKFARQCLNTATPVHDLMWPWPCRPAGRRTGQGR
ncbi:MAG: hypothetical protein HYU77_07895 [Betaproteobacteria bacterium]|nr:hypothetical protein [Betaproteobacteria bacterium]